MDNLDLLSRLRTSCMLVNLITVARDKGIPADVLKSIEGTHRRARNVLNARTMMFGDRRLMSNERFADLVNNMGPIISDFRTSLGRLPSEVQDKFRIEINYEPVPGPDDFGMLPEKVTTMLHNHVVGRMSKLWVIGKRELVMRMENACEMYAKRVCEFDVFDPAMGSGRTRAILRESIVEDALDAIRINGYLNVDESVHVSQMLKAAAPMLNQTVDALRNSATARQAVIPAALAVTEMARQYKV